MADTARQWAKARLAAGASQAEVEAELERIGAIEGGRLSANVDRDYAELKRLADEGLSAERLDPEMVAETEEPTPVARGREEALRSKAVEAVRSGDPSRMRLAAAAMGLPEPPTEPVVEPEAPIDVRAETERQREREEERFTLPEWLSPYAKSKLKAMGRIQREEALDAFRRRKRLGVDVDRKDNIDHIVERATGKPEPKLELEERRKGLSGVAKRIAGAGARTAGIPVGAAKELSETAVAPVLEGAKADPVGEVHLAESAAQLERGEITEEQHLGRVAMREHTRERRSRLTGGEIAKAYRQTEEDLHQRLADSSAFLASKDAAEREGLVGAVARGLAVAPIPIPSKKFGPIDNLPSYINTGFDAATDLRDNALGIAQLVGFVAGMDVSDEELEQGFIEFLKNQYARGEELGRTLTGGALGGTAAILRNPLDALETRPVSTIMVLGPLLRSIPKGRRTPGVQRLLDASEETTRLLKEDPLAKYIQPIRKKLIGGGQGERGKILAGVRRVFADMLAQSTPEFAGRLEDLLLDTMQQSPAEVQGMFEQVIRAYEEGTLTQQDLFGILQRRPSLKSVPRPEAPPPAPGVPPGAEPASKFTFERVPVEARLAQIESANRHPGPRARELLRLWQEVETHEAGAVRDRMLDVRHQIRARVIPSIETKFAKNRRGMTHTEGLRLQGQIDDLKGLVEAMDEALEGPDVLAGGAARRGRPLERESVIIRERLSPEGQRVPDPDTVAREQRIIEEDAGRKLARRIFTEEEIAADPKLKDPRLLVQALESPVRRQPLELVGRLSDRGRKVVGDIAHVMRDTYKAGDVIKSRTTPEPLLRKAGTEAVRQGIAFLPEERLIEHAFGAILDDSVQKLMAPKFRKLIIKRAKDRGALAAWDDVTIDGKLKDMAKAHHLDRLFEYELFDEASGAHVNLLDEMVDTYRSLPEEVQREVTSDALRRVGAEIAWDVQNSHMRTAVADELRRFGMDVGKVHEVVTNIVDAVGVKGGPMPVALGRFGVRDLTREFAANRGRYAQQLVDSGRYTPEEAERAVTILSSRIANSYEPIAPRFQALADVMPKTFAEGTNLLEPMGVGPQMSPVGLKGVHQGFQASAGWFLENQRQIHGGLDNALYRWSKAALTILNPVTHVNNFGANVIYQATRRGKTAMGIMKDLADTRMALRRYKSGTLDDPRMVRAIRAIERTDLLDTDLVSAEFGTLEAGAAEGLIPRAVKGSAGRLMEGMGKAYQWGDHVFKFDEALRNSLSVMDRLDALDVGERISMRISERSWVTMRKTGAATEAKPYGSWDVLRHAKGERAASARKISDARVPELVARASGVPAKKIFVDYSNVPIAVNWIRQSKLGGLVSPFFTWQHKVLDLPGKTGLGYELMFGEAGVWTPTSNAAVNRLQQASMAEVALRRAVTTQALRAEFLRQDAEGLRELMKWLPANQGMLLVHKLADPGYVEYVDLEAMNSLYPTVMAFRVGAAAAIEAMAMADPDWAVEAMYPDMLPTWAKEAGAEVGESRKALRARAREDLDAGRIDRAEFERRMATVAEAERDFSLEQLDPEERERVLERRRLWERLETGEIASAADVLKLFGTSGHMFAQMITEWQQAERRGKDVKVEDLVRDYGAVLLGAGTSRILDFAAGEIDPTSPLSTKQFSISAHEKELEEGWGRFIRLMVGKYPRVKATQKQYKKQRRMMKEALASSLVRGLKRRRKLATLHGEETPEELEWRDEEIERLAEIAGDIMDRAFDEQDAVVSHIEGGPEQ